jgi:hypothetical protein
MLPLGFLSLALAVVAAAVAWRSAARGWAIVAAVSAFAIIVSYPLFFADANATFAAGGLPDREVATLLRQWGMWHWGRTILGLIGFSSAVLALRRLQRS